MKKAKVVLCGDSQAGKSCLSQQFSTNQFIPQYFHTVGLDFLSGIIEIGNESRKLKIWDTNGCARFKQGIRPFLSGADAIALVYDVSCREKLTGVESWVTDVLLETNAPVVLVGNKVDKVREVTYEEGKQVADDLGMVYVETTATETHSATALFTLLTQIIRRHT